MAIPKGTNLVPGNPGNSGGKKKRSGRKPNWFTEQCSNLTDTQVLPKIRRKLRDSGPDDRNWWEAANYVARFSKSEAPRKTEVTGEDGGPIQVQGSIRWGSTEIPL